jgi:hypothetical protein
MGKSPTVTGSSAAAPAPSPAAAAATSGALSGSIGKWDQFHANEKLFNVKSSFDENLYTTELDKSKLHTKQILKAERLAREIEGSVSANLHIQQERNQAIEGDYDEEDLYSGVLARDRGDDKKRAPSAGSAKATTKAGGSASKSPPKQRTAPGSAASVAVAGTEPAAASSSSKSAQQQPQTPKKMNYAAAAAKTVPPGFTSKKDGPEADDAKKSKEPREAKAVDEAGKKESEIDEPASGAAQAQDAKVSPEADTKNGPSKSSEEPADKEPGPAEPGAPVPKLVSNIEATQDTQENAKTSNEGSIDAPAPKPTSKLNVNAKSFTFNINAKSFTPGGVGSSAVEPSQVAQHQQLMPHQQHPQHPMHMQPYGFDPNTGMPYMVDPNMAMPHHMYPPMGQPGSSQRVSFFRCTLHPRYLSGPLRFSFLPCRHDDIESAVRRDEVSVPWNGAANGDDDPARSAAITSSTTPSATSTCTILRVPTSECRSKRNSLSHHSVRRRCRRRRRVVELGAALVSTPATDATAAADPAHAVRDARRLGVLPARSNSAPNGRCSPGCVPRATGTAPAAVAARGPASVCANTWWSARGVPAGIPAAPLPWDAWQRPSQHDASGVLSAWSWSHGPSPVPVLRRRRHVPWKGSWQGSGRRTGRFLRWRGTRPRRRCPGRRRRSQQRGSGPWKRLLRPPNPSPQHPEQRQADARGSTFPATATSACSRKLSVAAAAVRFAGCRCPRSIGGFGHPAASASPRDKCCFGSFAVGAISRKPREKRER